LGYSEVRAMVLEIRFCFGDYSPSEGSIYATISNGIKKYWMVDKVLHKRIDVESPEFIVHTCEVTETESIKTI
jgi:hypothetical protein